MVALCSFTGKYKLFLGEKNRTYCGFNRYSFMLFVEFYRRVLLQINDERVRSHRKQINFLSLTRIKF